MALPEAYRDEFRTEQNERLEFAAWVVVVIALWLMVLSTVMDYVSYPEHFGTLTLIRFATVGVLALQAIIHTLARRRGVAVRYARVFVWSFICTISLSMDLMNLVVGGPETPYYAGITLLLIGVQVALPWGFREMTGSMLFILVQYDLLMLLFDPDLTFKGMFKSNYFHLATIFIGVYLAWARHRLQESEFLSRKLMEEEKARSEGLLLNILPKDVADELKDRGKVDARNIDDCTILFTDFVGFTKLSGRVTPARLVESLDRAFTRFDDIITRWGLEKLKTIGDAYMCAGGVFGHQPDHLPRCIAAGLEMLKVLEEDDDLRAADDSPWRMRIGIHTGPVVAGVIGQKKFAYDLWGDTVNTASRLEASGQPRSINLSTAVFKQVEGLFVGVDRGFVPVRGKGPMGMTRVTRLRPELSGDPAGMVPGDAFIAEMTRWAAGRRGVVAGEEPMRLRRLGEVDLSKEGMDSLRVLSELTTEDREVLMQLARPINFKAGQVIIEQGQSLSVLFLILEGRVGVRIARESVSIEVGLLGPGEVVGELSFVSWEPASATVIALEDVTALRFDHDWMESLTSRHPQTGVHLFHSLALVLAQRVREANARLFAWGVEHEQGRRTLARRKVASPMVPMELEAALVRFAERIAALEKSEDATENRLMARVGDACDELVAAGARMVVRGEDGAMHVDAGVSGFFLRETFSYFMRSEVMERMYAKPLGVPLDHLALEHIVRGEPAGYGSLGVLVDAWFIRRSVGRLVRACVLAAGAEVEGAYRESRDGRGGAPFALSVLGSGTAPEVFEALERLDRPVDVQITCFDPDLGALAALGQRASHQGQASRFSLVCDTGIQAPGRGTASFLAPQHCVVCSLVSAARDDASLLALLESAHGFLRPGGRLVLGGLDPAADTFFVATGLLEWQIPVLSEERVRRLVQQSPFSEKQLKATTSPDGQWRVVLLTRS